MARKLRVYATNHAPIDPTALIEMGGPAWVRQGTAVVAATSQKAAAELFGLPLSSFRNYGGETGNKLHIEVAMQEPGVPYIGTLDHAATIEHFRPAVLDRRRLTIRPTPPTN